MESQKEPEQSTETIDGLSTGSGSERPFDFMGLPAELRDRIYALACYHHENDGAIAPLHWKTDGSFRFYSFINGEYVQGRIIMRHFEENELGLTEDDFTNLQRETMRTRDLLKHFICIYKGLKGNAEEAEYCTAHFCRPKCLLQPALTKVSRQARNEALPVFYGVNSFHFSIPRLGEFQEIRLPRWWQAVQDTNLRYIKSWTTYNNRGKCMHVTALEDRTTVTLTGATYMRSDEDDKISTMTPQEWRESGLRLPTKHLSTEIITDHLVEYATRIEEARLCASVLNGMFDFQGQKRITPAEEEGNIASSVEAMRRFEDRYSCW